MKSRRFLKMTAHNFFYSENFVFHNFDCNSCCYVLSQCMYLLNVYCNSDQAFRNLYKSVINTRTNRSCFTLSNYAHDIMYITISLSCVLIIFVLYSLLYGKWKIFNELIIYFLHLCIYYYIFMYDTKLLW